MSSQTIQVEQIKHFLKELQNRITDKLEALESDARFQRETWERSEIGRAHV